MRELDTQVSQKVSTFEFGQIIHNNVTPMKQVIYDVLTMNNLRGTQEVQNFLDSMSGASIANENFPAEQQFNPQVVKRRRNRSASNIHRHGNSYSYENTANHSPIMMKQSQVLIPDESGPRFSQHQTASNFYHRQGLDVVPMFNKENN